MGASCEWDPTNARAWLEHNRDMAAPVVGYELGNEPGCYMPEVSTALHASLVFTRLAHTHTHTHTHTIINIHTHTHTREHKRARANTHINTNPIKVNLTGAQAALDFAALKKLIAQVHTDPAERPLVIGPDVGACWRGSEGPRSNEPILEGKPPLDVITFHHYVLPGGAKNGP
jgi:hypothetical protein